jgi:hypothetical protein
MRLIKPVILISAMTCVTLTGCSKDSKSSKSCQWSKGDFKLSIPLSQQLTFDYQGTINSLTAKANKIVSDDITKYTKHTHFKTLKSHFFSTINDQRQPGSLDLAYGPTKVNTTTSLNSRTKAIKYQQKLSSDELSLHLNNLLPKPIDLDNVDVKVVSDIIPAQQLTSVAFSLGTNIKRSMILGLMGAPASFYRMVPKNVRWSLNVKANGKNITTDKGELSQMLATAFYPVMKAIEDQSYQTADAKNCAVDPQTRSKEALSVASALQKAIAEIGESGHVTKGTEDIGIGLALSESATREMPASKSIKLNADIKFNVKELADAEGQLALQRQQRLSRMSEMKKPVRVGDSRGEFQSETESGKYSPAKDGYSPEKNRYSPAKGCDAYKDGKRAYPGYSKTVSHEATLTAFSEAFAGIDTVGNSLSAHANVFSKWANRQFNNTKDKSMLLSSLNADGSLKAGKDLVQDVLRDQIAVSKIESQRTVIFLKQELKNKNLPKEYRISIENQLTSMKSRLKKIKQEESLYKNKLIPALIEKGYVGVGCESQCYIVNLKVENGVLKINGMPAEQWTRGVEALGNHILYS